MRAAHSIKGAARIVGLNHAVSLAHAMEDVLSAAQQGKRPLEPEGVDLLLKGNDLFAALAVSALAVVMIVVGMKYALGIGSKGTYISMPFLSKFWMYFPIPLAGCAMIVFELEAIYNHIRKFFVKEGDAQ
jgi:hypothetical protein